MSTQENIESIHTTEAKAAVIATSATVLPFGGNTAMKEICKVGNNAMLMGAWGRDVGTMERKLMLVAVYPSGEVSPIREYNQSKLTDHKALKDLADLDGIVPSRIEEIYTQVIQKSKELTVQEDSCGKCSLKQAYESLCEYVQEYEEPGKVFMKDGYGNILATYLETVLDKLAVGYTRLELQKNFKAWKLLQVNHGTGHPYTYQINLGGKRGDWFFSFRLPETAREEMAG